jgi:hypothetical protein
MMGFFWARAASLKWEQLVKLLNDGVLEFSSSRSERGRVAIESLRGVRNEYCVALCDLQPPTSNLTRSLHFFHFTINSPKASSERATRGQLNHRGFALSGSALAPELVPTAHQNVSHLHRHAMGALLYGQLPKSSEYQQAAP